MALLRGINVGGKNLVPMTQLTEVFAEAGCTEMRTYIQSGNVVFSAPAALAEKLPALLIGKIAARFGCRVPVILRTTEQMARVIRDNPFLADCKSEKMLHVYFLADAPDPSAVQGLDPNRSTPDEFKVRNREVYLHMPNGMGRTKLTNAYFDSKLSTISTARNWATTLKLLEMMNS